MIIGKIQAYVFYVLRNSLIGLSRKPSRDGLEDWKAAFVMSIATTFVVIIATSLVSVLVGHRVLLPESRGLFVALYVGITMGMFFFNHYSMIYQRKWVQYEREFRKRSRITRVLGGIAVWVALVAIVVVFEWALSAAWRLPS